MNTGEFANIPTSKTNVYVFGQTKVQIEKVALYLGRSYSNDEDWFCMGKIYINGKEVFKCEKSGYGPELLEDDYIVSRALDHAFSRKSEQEIYEFRQLEKTIKNISTFDALFKRKEVLANRKKYEKAGESYACIKALRDGESLLRLIQEHKTPAEPQQKTSGQKPSQPGDD